MLLQEYNKRKHTLKSKFDPQITANVGFVKIATKINSRSLVKWSIQEIKKIYDNLTVMSKKEITNFRRESNKTGDINFTCRSSCYTVVNV